MTKTITYFLYGIFDERFNSLEEAIERASKDKPTERWRIHTIEVDALDGKWIPHSPTYYFTYSKKKDVWIQTQ